MLEYNVENEELEYNLESEEGFGFETPKTEVNKDYEKLKNKPSINGIELFGNLSTEQLKLNYEKLLNLPSINGFPLIGNKTTNDLGIVGTSMTEIEVSTNPETPTDISQYFEKSGTYVAKDYGIIGFNDFITPIAKGGFFTVQNFKDDASKFGIEVSDEDNVIMVSVFYYDGGTFEEVMLKKIGTEDWYAGVKITSLNAQDYLDLDIDVTSEVQQVLKNAVSNSYGMQLIGNYLSFISASNSDIDYANTPYRVITPSNGEYLVRTKGANYFTSKTEFEELKTDVSTLKTDVSTLKTEIETILESVVVIDE